MRKLIGGSEVGGGWDLVQRGYIGRFGRLIKRRAFVQSRELSAAFYCKMESGWELRLGWFACWFGLVFIMKWIDAVRDHGMERAG